MLSEVNKVDKDNPILVFFLLYFVPTPRLFWPPRLLIFQNPWSPPVYFDPPVYYEPESTRFDHMVMRLLCTSKLQNLLIFLHFSANFRELYW